MSRANRVKRSNPTGRAKNKRAAGILAARRLQWAAPHGRYGWRRLPLPNRGAVTTAALRRAGAKRERRRLRNLALRACGGYGR